MPYSYEILPDKDPMNPRKEWDNLGTMVCWHRRYDLGDEQIKNGNVDDFMLNLASEIDPDIEDKLQRLEDKWYSRSPSYQNNEAYRKTCDIYWANFDKVRQERIGNLIDRGYIMLPLYLYDHSGITMNTGGYPCPWDSGQVGYIYLSIADAKKEYDWKNMTQARREKIAKYLSDEVEVYDQYLTGDVWGYQVTDDDGNEVDSCWGFFGYDYCEEEAKSAMTCWSRGENGACPGPLMQ